MLMPTQAETDNVECLKTCCGALAILAKDETNKVLIAKDGTRLILKLMECHMTRPDLQVRGGGRFYSTTSPGRK